MKAIAKLKDDARKHEQKEEWEKAIQAYLQVLKLGEQEGGAELDLPLYNRVGDLYVRLGRPSDAVTYYEQAADRYAEAGLYNNAIALCNKALRYEAGRLPLFRKLGSFSASQGFFTDARRWYLEYAERAIKLGRLDDAISALSDYADVNDDADARELLARKLRDNGRTERAVAEFKRAYSLRMAAGQHAEAERIRNELQAIDPKVDLSDAPQARVHTHSSYDDSDQLPGFVDLDEPRAPSSPAPAPVEAAPPPPVQEPEAIEIEPTAIAGSDVEAEPADFESIDLDHGLGSIDASDVEELDIGIEQPIGLEVEPEETESFDLPTLGEEEAAADALSLPPLDDVETDEISDLPMLGEEEDLPEDAEPLPGFDGISVEADLPMIETEDVDSTTDIGLETLDMGDFERAEVGYAGEPLGSLTFEPVDAADAAEADAADEVPDDVAPLPGLPSFDEDSEFGEFAPERAFEFITPEPEAEFEAEAEAEFEAEPEAEFEAEPEAEYEAEAVAESFEEPVEESFDGPVEEPAAAPVADIEPEPEPWLDPEPEPEPEPEPVAQFIAPVSEPERAPEPPPAPAPVAPARPRSDYVDLAALLSDDEEEAEDSTRFVVAEKAPTGDEEQDFADMLEQFKSKVAASIPTEDAGSHYDLGIAFKEMGLIDEAIGEFQTALRAGQEKLKVYEELGSCFVIKAQYSVAITILNRAAQMPFKDEQELLGVYYNLGRAHEELGQRAEAKAAYEKIVAIDIGFQDTTHRLGRL